MTRETVAGKMLREIGQRVREQGYTTDSEGMFVVEVARDVLGAERVIEIADEFDDDMSGFALFLDKCAEEADAFAERKREVEGGQIPPQEQA